GAQGSSVTRRVDHGAPRRERSASDDHVCPGIDDRSGAEGRLSADLELRVVGGDKPRGCVELDAVVENDAAVLTELDVDARHQDHALAELQVAAEPEQLDRDRAQHLQPRAAVNALAPEPKAVVQAS